MENQWKNKENQRKASENKENIRKIKEKTRRNLGKWRNINGKQRNYRNTSPNRKKKKKKHPKRKIQKNPSPFQSMSNQYHTFTGLGGILVFVCVFVCRLYSCSHSICLTYLQNYKHILILQLLCSTIKRPISAWSVAGNIRRCRCWFTVLGSLFFTNLADLVTLNSKTCWWFRVVKLNKNPCLAGAVFPPGLQLHGKTSAFAALL